MKIGKKLKELKTLRKVKLRDIAEKTGLSVSYISDIINEKANPSLDTLLKLSDYLGVPPSQFIGEDPVSYLTPAEARLRGLLEDFSLWPANDQEDLLEYAAAKKKTVLMKRKEEQ